MIVTPAGAEDRGGTIQKPTIGDAMLLTRG